eukprot:scaffold330_cov109-Isochrysis_galbana.AAC.7
MRWEQDERIGAGTRLRGHPRTHALIECDRGAKSYPSAARRAGGVWCGGSARMEQGSRGGS